MQDTSGNTTHTNTIPAYYSAKLDYPPLPRVLTDEEIEKLRVALHWLTLVTQQEVNRHAI
jgi:hypothetical protein